MAIAVDARREQAVGAAHHGVLLVDDGRNPRSVAASTGGKRRIAAEADHRHRPEPAQQRQALAATPTPSMLTVSRECKRIAAAEGVAGDDVGCRAGNVVP